MEDENFAFGGAGRTGAGSAMGSGPLTVRTPGRPGYWVMPATGRRVPPGPSLLGVRGAAIALGGAGLAAVVAALRRRRVALKLRRRPNIVDLLAPHHFLEHFVAVAEVGQTAVFD